MRIRQLAVVGLAAVLLTACGGSDGNGEAAKKGPQVAADAADALEQVGAAHMSGNGTLDGKPMTVDLRLQGQDATGTMQLGGQKVELTNVGGSFYMKGSAGFWQLSGVPEAVTGTLADKWVVVPSSVAGQLGEFSLKGMADRLRHPTSGGTIKDAVRTDTLDGVKVVVVTQADGSTLDVAATGTPYPLRTVDKGKDAGTITVNDFGKKTTITAPSGALDLSQLGA